MSFKVLEQGDFAIEITPPTNKVEQVDLDIQSHILDIDYLYHKSNLHVNNVINGKGTVNIKDSVKNKSFEEIWKYMLLSKKVK